MPETVSSEQSKKVKKLGRTICAPFLCMVSSASLADQDRNSALDYLSSFLGHKGPMEAHYYYHQVEDAFHTIKRKDEVSSRVIPEVQHEE